MIRGLRGSLLSHDALSRAIPRALAGRLGEGERDDARRAFRSWILRASADLGPSCGPRVVFDRVGAPLAALLGYRAVVAPIVAPNADGVLHARLDAGGAPAAVMLITAWGVDGASAWRAAVRNGIAAGVRWCLCVNGPTVRLLDARRTYSRRFAQIDLAAAASDPPTFEVLWGLFRADAVVAPPGTAPTLDRAVELCEKHRIAVRNSLQAGVRDALTSLLGAFAAARRAERSPLLFDESLVVIYRILFLLFAEARGLVPRWHPTYREAYTIESLRVPAEKRLHPRGTWEALQAIARLAHRGCRAGALRVPPFNGRLFSPAHAPLADSVPLDDGAVQAALLALTTTRSSRGMERISYADLGVEQLGGVYERILDFEPSVEKPKVTAATPLRSGISLVRAQRRKATGSFYTPRALTEYLVRRTLAPLVRDATPEQILELRVLDPAMGSGAFLVAACRYLASAYESALVRETGLTLEDIGDRERAGFRRTIAQRCLFGVDLNPMAVQLGRLSLWLATLAADKPLTFLDHHLRAGNSLLGASLADLVRNPFAKGRRPNRRSAAPLPLFDDGALDGALRTAIGPRMSIALEPGDTLEQVRAKERVLGRLEGDDGPLARWKRVADLWCARWFLPEGADSRAGANSTWQSGVFSSLADELLGRPATLPARTAASLLAGVRASTARERFFHWTLEFPEVFFANDGHPLANGGFDAVIGNPPWEMLRGDLGSADARTRAGRDAARLTEFARGSGVYRLQCGGHANLFQLFLERALALVRGGGRLGMVLPSGFASDHGCAALRRHLFTRTHVDTFVSMDNRDALFPIHRGLRFLLLCLTAGGDTTVLPMHSGLRSTDALDRLPDAGVEGGAIVVQRSLIERFTGSQLAVPDLRSSMDLAIVAKIASTAPPLGSSEGWNVHFGRELNASDDRHHFGGGPRALPVVEGKHVQPFVVDVASAPHRIPRAAAARRLIAERTFARPRLAYRDVAASTNKLTLIAAVVPAGVVTTHTLFCLKDLVSDDVQLFLCGVFNSYVANYLVRLRVGTHVTTTIVEQLPVAVPERTSRAFEEIARLAEALTRDPRDQQSAAQLQARVASMYGLTATEFDHVLSTFPLVEEHARAAALSEFRRL